MSTNAQDKPRRIPMRWAWFLLVLAILFTAVTLYVGPFLWTEKLVRRLEAQGVSFVRRQPAVTHPIHSLIAEIPGFENWNKAVSHISIQEVKVSSQDRLHVLQLARHFKVEMYVQLSQSQNLNQELAQLAGREFTTLDLSYNELDAESFELLTKVRRLEALILAGCEFDNQDLPVLARVPRLQFVDFSQSALNDEGMEHLCSVTSLNELATKGARISNKSKIALRRVIPHLHYRNF